MFMQTPIQTTINGKQYKTILVEEDTPRKDEKTPVERPMALDPRMKMVLANAGRGKNGKLKPLNTSIVLTVNQTAAANTANTSIIPVQPSTSADYTYFNNIYDEVIVHGGALHFAVTTTGSGAQPTGLNTIGGLAYDPVNSGVYVSVEATQEASQSILFKWLVDDGNFGGGTITTSSPTGVSKNGLYNFKFKVPAGKPARNTATVTNISGEYGAMSDGSDTWGWIKPYIRALGANNQSTLYGYLVMKVTFRSRT